MTVNPALSISTNSLPDGIVGTAYSQTISATGGTGARTWSIASGALPGGLSLSGSGTISGTPNAGGAFSFTVKVSDTAGASTTKALSIQVVTLPSITTSSLSALTVGQPVSLTLGVSGGLASYTWSIQSGALPAGVSLSAAGQISGSPSAAGTASFTVKVVDSNGKQDTKALSWVVNGAPSITTSSLPKTTVNRPLSTTTMQAVGGTPSLTWSASGLPAGITLTSGGQLSGTPTSSGTSQVQITVTDRNGVTDVATLSLVVNAQPQITTASLAALTVNAAATRAIDSTGGTAAYSWSITSGSAPSGMSLNPSTGKLSGTPQSAGQASFTVTLTDAAGAQHSQSFVVEVNASPKIVTTSLSDLTSGVPGTRPVTASGGTAPLSWSVASGSLPAGMTLNSSTGVISGTPAAPGSSSFTLRVTDANQAFADKAFTLVVNEPPAINLNGGFADLTQGTHATRSVSSTGGSPAVSWSVSAGALPAGISLNTSTGVVSGTPSTPGSFSFTLQVTDANGAKATRSFNVTVHAKLAFTTPSQLESAYVGSNVTRALSVTGGAKPLTWSLAGGSLPAGFALSPGSIAGLASTEGSWSMEVQVTDANGAHASRTFTISILNEPVKDLRLETSGVPSAGVGSAYQVSLQASGGSKPYHWTVSAGALPPGLGFNPATGRLTGTPLAAGEFSFTITVTDQDGNSRSKSFVLRVEAGPELRVFPLALSFFGHPGQSATKPQDVAITSTPSNLAITASADAPWLALSLDREITPAVLRVTALPADLEPGVYTAVITVEGPETRIVQVSLEVAAETPYFRAEPPSLSFTIHPNAPQESQLVRIVASGPLAPVSLIPAPAAASWLAVEPVSAEAGSQQPALFRVRVDPSALLEGRRDTFLTVMRGAEATGVPLSVTVVKPRLDFDLSHTALSFHATAGTSPVLAQELILMNRAADPLAWVAAASAPWIRFQPSSGTVSTAAPIAVEVDTRGLAAGVYNGTITVTPHSGDLQKEVQVTLRISSGHVPPRVAPTGLYFPVQAGESVPEQRVVFHNPSAWPVSYTSSLTAEAGWLTVAPASGTLAAGGSLEVVASVAGQILTPGLHRAELVVEFSDRTVHVVEILATVAEEGCEATYLVPLATRLGQHFQARAALPSPIEVLVVDNCGQRVETGAGLVSFSLDGESALPLIPGVNGLWHATWIPAAPAASITLRIEVTDPAGNLLGTAHLTGTVAKP